MEIGDRISMYASSKGITIAEFERISGLGNGYVRKIRNTVGRRKLEDILSAFPDLNRVWLLTGEGEMLNSQVVQTNRNGDNINGNSVNVSKGGDGELVAYLRKEIELKDKIIAEKERLINVLMEGRK